MLRLLVLLICSITFSFAEAILDSNESNETNSSTLFTPKAQSIFLSYESTPNKVYVGELFAVKVKAIIANDDFEDITSSFQDYENLKIINPDAKWQWFNDNIFYNTFYMKADNTNAKLPSLTLNIYQDSIKIDSETLEAKAPSIIKLNGTKYFSKVIAKSLKIKKHKTTQFDDKSYIIVLEIEAEEANLNDFKLKWVIRDGIDSSSSNLPYFKIFYYAIIPDFTKEFIFTYFDRDTNKFEKITIPIVVTDDKISTQIDLNPAQSSLQIYKDSIYGIIALILIILFIRRRKVGYIIFLVLLIAFFIYDKNLFNSIKIDKGSQIQILPTKKSTIFYTTNRTLYAQKLGQKDSYIKILLPNGKIGWIDDSKN
jgi:hypothetical protein